MVSLHHKAMLDVLNITHRKYKIWRPEALLFIISSSRMARAQCEIATAIFQPEFSYLHSTR